MSSTAARVREHKETSPDLYCLTAGCLFRTSTFRGFVPCPKHPRPTPDVMQRAADLASTDTVGGLTATAEQFRATGNYAAATLFNLAAGIADAAERKSA